ncbi:MAG TPA: Lrp/AsnC family transcriptional regulator [Candidatus Competibacteraceae bacterium]|nr:Lrp/AsnC family transcriptional regulator [Candidatus Competibacteraceae bacterium]
MDTLDFRLLDEFQRNFPLQPRPYAVLAERLGVDEAEVIARLRRLQGAGRVSRVGAVFAPNRAGRSILAALAVPAAELEAVAELVGALPEVNHCYQREHDTYNLWFVLTAPDATHLHAALAEIEARTGLMALDLPLEREYHIDLGFPLQS